MMVTFFVNVSTGYIIREGWRPIRPGSTFSAELTPKLRADVDNGRLIVVGGLPDPTVEDIDPPAAGLPEEFEVEVAPVVPAIKRRRNKKRAPRE